MPSGSKFTLLRYKNNVFYYTYDLVHVFIRMAKQTRPNTTATAYGGSTALENVRH